MAEARTVTSTPAHPSSLFIAQRFSLRLSSLSPKSVSRTFSTMPGPVDLVRIARDDGRFSVEAFQFVSESLGHAADLYGKRQLVGSARHLTAVELVTGAVDLAAQRWSLLGDLVLASWGIRDAGDIGMITFTLIEHGVFSKEPSDRLEDFKSADALVVAVASRVRARVGLDG